MTCHGQKKESSNPSSDEVSAGQNLDAPAIRDEGLADVDAQARLAVRVVSAEAGDDLEAAVAHDPVAGPVLVGQGVPPVPDALEGDGDAILHRHAVQVDRVARALPVDEELGLEADGLAVARRLGPRPLCVERPRLPHQRV